jgi:exodeoxyribonuclease V gamma subunit
MIRLHYSNRLEALISPLAEAIRAQQRARPLESVTIVVPNRTMENFIKHRVSEAIGIAANLDFPFLRRFLADTLRAVDSNIRVLDVDELEIIFFQTLRRVVRSDDPGFEPLRDYVDLAHATEADKELRTYRLATQLARLFREYSISRQSMLRRWSAGDRGSEDSPSPIELWQKRLWNLVFDSHGNLREASSNSSGNRWMMVPQAFETVSRTDLKAALPRIVHVFALAYAGPAYARIFSLIGTLTDLELYTLNPCMEFWEDVENFSHLERAAWVRRHSKLGQDFEVSDDPFQLVTTEDTPALRLWARPGREYLRMLNELTECDFEAHFAHHERTSTLLAGLQEDILNRAPQKVLSDSNVNALDGSIKFLACPSIAREAEIVANDICSMLEEEASDSDPIRFHQIAVMVPDASYQDYLPHLESAFARLHQLPIDIVSRATNRDPSVLEAVHLLLRLPMGRLTREEILHFLNHPAVKADDAPFDSEQTSRWCAEAGILFGADAGDLSGTYIPPDTYHWDQGLKRIALGVFMDTEQEDELRFYRSPESTEYLPSPIAQDEASAAAAFIKGARQLLHEAIQIRSHKWPLDRWARLLSDMILAHLRADTAGDKQVRDRCVKAIESIAVDIPVTEPVAYPLVHELVTRRIGEQESLIARFTERGIAVGPLSALRAIPFRAIFLLGLNESLFPARQPHDPMDLRLMHRRAGDVTPTERDRYLFIETLLAARERIRFSYVAIDLKAGSALEPSSIVHELQFILSSYLSRIDLKDLTIEHPLSRYDRRYFPELAPGDLSTASHLNSYDRDARSGAIAAALRDDLSRHCGNLELPGRDEPLSQQLSPAAKDQLESVLRTLSLPLVAKADVNDTSEIWLPISSLRKFLECPLQGAAQYALGIFDDDDEDLADFEDEPIAQSLLNRTNLLREVFWKVKGDPRRLKECYEQASRISQLTCNAPVGPFARAAQDTDLDAIRNWMAQARDAGCGALDAWQELRLGRGDHLAKADRVLGELSFVLPARTGERSNRIVKLYGSLGFVSPYGTASIRAVLRDQAKPKHFLGPIMTAIVLAASGELDDDRFRAILIGAGKKQAWQHSRTLDNLSTGVARDYLSNLIGDMLLERNHYFLPIEAVERADKEFVRGRDAEVLDVINDFREDEFASCSSDFGPIRNARRFEPPTLEEIKRITDRRFRLIHSIFERIKD